MHILKSQEHSTIKHCNKHRTFFFFFFIYIFYGRNNSFLVLILVDINHILWVCAYTRTYSITLTEFVKWKSLNELVMCFISISIVMNVCMWIYTMDMSVVITKISLLSKKKTRLHFIIDWHMCAIVLLRNLSKKNHWWFANYCL